MPTYQYKCLSCNKIIESYQNIRAKKLETHRQIDPTSNCEGSVIRLIGKGNTFILKGAGFFRNDYPKEKK